MSSSKSTFVLFSLAITTALVYQWGMVESFDLYTLLEHPVALDLSALSQEIPHVYERLILCFLCLGLIYWLSWRMAVHAQGPLAWCVVLGAGFIFGWLLLFLYPVDAADIFDNIMHGRITAVYGGNPFSDVASQYTNDPFLSYTAWVNVPSAYGPLWELLAAGTVWVAGDNLIATVLLFKVVGGFFWLGCIGLIVAILHSQVPNYALPGTLLFTWNPIILYETFGNGHNDIVMMFWVLVAIWALAHHFYLASSLALVTGALVKYMPLLLLPAVIAIMLRNLPTRKIRLEYLAKTTITVSFLTIFVYALFWDEEVILGLSRRSHYYTTSLSATFFYGWIEPRFGNLSAMVIVSTAAAGLTVAFALWQAYRIYVYPERSRILPQFINPQTAMIEQKHPDGLYKSDLWQGFTQASLYIFLFYLMVTCLWFQPWYLVWPLTLIPLLPMTNIVRLTLLFGFSAQIKPLLLIPWLMQPPVPSKAWREIRLGPLTMAMPWLFALSIVIGKRVMGKRDVGSDRKLRRIQIFCILRNKNGAKVISDVS